MSGAVRARRGQPLVVLVLVLGAWTAGRTVLWESPLPSINPLKALEQPWTGPQLAASEPSHLVSAPDAAAAAAPFRAESGFAYKASRPSAEAPAGFPAEKAGQPGFGAAHQMLFLAGFAAVPVTQPLPQARHGRVEPFKGVTALAAQMDRWRFSGWAHYRPGSGRRVGSAGLAPNTYGASQAGAVLRYGLRPHSPYRPEFYLRASGALVEGGEREAALGLSARPFRQIPVAAHAELRASEGPGGLAIRPAAFVATEAAPHELPLGLRAEGYAQAGYVAGRFSTAFVDGSLRLSREVAAFDLGRVRAGAGSWGGAQKDAARLDVGPTASIETCVSEGCARLSVDYRLRVAGDAQPASGVAVSIATDF